MAYCSWQDCISASTQKIRECLLKLVQSLLYLAFHLFRPGNRALFRFGGVRGRPLSTELLLKRYIDLVWICLINIQDGDHELQDFDSQPLVDCKIKLKQVRVFGAAVVQVETNQSIDPTLARQWP